MNEVWERLEGETNKAFSAFCVYRDLRHNRSFTRVQVQLRKKSKSHIAVWSKKFGWVSRVKSFDDFEDRQNRIAQQESIQAMNKRQAQQSENFQRILFLPVNAFSQRLAKGADGKIIAIEDLNKMKTTDLIDLISKLSSNFSSLVNIERIARGAPTEIGKLENTLIVPKHVNKYGEIVANDEEATNALTKYLFRLGHTENGKPSDNGNVSVSRKIPDGSTSESSE